MYAILSIVPPDAITATVSSSGTATAGMVYSLTCNVSKTVGDLTNTPTATWTTGGEAVNNGNGITVANWYYWRYDSHFYSDL